MSNITFLENTIKKVVFRFKAIFLNTLGSKEAPTHLFGPLRTGLKSPYARPTRRVRRVLRRVRRDRKIISFDFCFFDRFRPFSILFPTGWYSGNGKSPPIPGFIPSAIWPFLRDFGAQGVS